VPGMSEHISVTRIVDRFLEHGRIFIFNNNDEPLVFSGSSDWMNKSMYRRIEVCYPVYDELIKQELLQLIAIQLSDNKKAVMLDRHMENIPIKPTDGQSALRSQETIYNLLKA
jgi:polyphosphate kinase